MSYLFNKIKRLWFKWRHPVIKVDMSKKIHEQISPDTWCQGVMFIGPDGKSHHQYDKDAVQCCLVGWIAKRYTKDSCAIAGLLAANMGIENYWKLPNWNDDPRTTFDDVWLALHKADI